MKHINKSTKRAFTLIELLIVIAIIGILFVVLISRVDFATDKAKASGVQTDFRSFQVAFETVSKENAGFASLGWDTGDENGNHKRDSYDEGDANKNNIMESTETWTGHKVPGENWTGTYTLVNPDDNTDKSAFKLLEDKVNANLDPKLHITITPEENAGVLTGNATVTMANGAQDPWKNEYHGVYITNALNDKADRGAFIIYSNGANGQWGSEHDIANGNVVITVPGNNVRGKDDYAMTVFYTYINGYGEIAVATFGFSNNQKFLGGKLDSDLNIGNNNQDNGGNNGGNVGDVNNVPVVGDTKQFATLITTTTLKDLYDLSTSPDKECGYASIAYNDNTYLCIDCFGTVYDIYYEFYNESEDYWYTFCYATEGIVDSGFVSEVGWYTYDDYGNLVQCAAPSITFVQDLTIEMPNGFVDILPLFMEHEHDYINCKCDCGDIKHMHEGLCPGLYEAGAIALAADGNVEAAQDMFKKSWNDLLDAGIVHLSNGAVYSNFVFIDDFTFGNSSSDILDGDLLLPNDGSITSIDDVVPAFGCCHKLTAIVIPDSVTSIGISALYNCESLTSVTIPNSVTSIGAWAFQECNNLISITIPDSVTSIGEGAFNDCDSLTNITIPDSVTSIARSMFDECRSLTSVIIPNSVTEIGGGAFSHCDSLTNITIPDSVTTIGEAAFSWCGSLTNITIPDGVMTIGLYMFDHCWSLTSIVIPDSVTSIGSNAFSGCTSLTSVVIPDSITSIGLYAFDNCSSLTSVVIGDSVASIGKYAFRDCSSLTDVYYTGSEAQWSGISIGSSNSYFTGATRHYNYQKNN